MTDRPLLKNAILTVTSLLVLVGAGATALLWSMDGSDIDVPTRPQAVALELTAEIPVHEEPMPEIRVPALKPPTV